MALDLGSVITGLGESYFSNKYSNQRPAGLALNQVPQVSVDNRQDSFGLPFVDVVSEPPDDCHKYIYDPNANCGAGKWMRKRRRRHRNLATRGDIRDLSALKGVLGSGKLLETWIATHS